jgi:hypothetical protein
MGQFIAMSVNFKRAKSSYRRLKGSASEDNIHAKVVQFFRIYRKHNWLPYTFKVNSIWVIPRDTLNLFGFSPKLMRVIYNYGKELHELDTVGMDYLPTRYLSMWLLDDDNYDQMWHRLNQQRAYVAKLKQDL